MCDFRSVCESLLSYRHVSLQLYLFAAQLKLSGFKSAILKTLVQVVSRFFLFLFFLLGFEGFPL